MPRRLVQQALIGAAFIGIVACDPSGSSTEPRAPTSFTTMDLSVGGGFSGRGTGEGFHLASNGLLLRFHRDSADPSREDTTKVQLTPNLIAHVDSVLARPDVRALPSPEDLVGQGKVSDGFTEHIVVDGSRGTILELTSSERYCADTTKRTTISSNADSTAPIIWTLLPSSCPVSSGMVALSLLVTYLRSIPVGVR